MPNARGVAHRLGHHTSTWAPSLSSVSDRERDALINELIDISCANVRFILTHVRGDGFYDDALKEWGKKLTHLKDVLHRLQVYGVVGGYTVCGLRIQWTWQDDIAERSHREEMKRIPLRFERINVPEEPMPRNPLHDAMMYELDGIAIRAKISAAPDEVSVDGWTEQHYRQMLREGSSGHVGHMLSMRLAGAVFQMDLVPPPMPERTRGKRTNQRVHQKTRDIATGWQKVNS